jgi:hypothetical protein
MLAPCRTNRLNSARGSHHTLPDRLRSRASRISRSLCKLRRIRPREAGQPISGQAHSMNKISLAAIAAATTTVILSPGAKATTLSVTHHCDPNSGGVLPFTWQYQATITGRNFVADYVSPYTGAETHIRGTIPSNGGETVLHLTGTTGNPKYTTGMPRQGTPYSFPIVATFDPPPRFAGTGYRNDKLRRCQFTFQ